MLKFLEKWVIKRFLKRILNSLPELEGKLSQFWADHNEELFEKVVEAIKITITNIVKKALEKGKK